MYTKDKSKIVNVRVTENQYNFIVSYAKEYNMKPAEFLRFLITIAQKDFEQNRADERL